MNPFTPTVLEQPIIDTVFSSIAYQQDAVIRSSYWTLSIILVDSASVVIEVIGDVDTDVHWSNVEESVTHSDLVVLRQNIPS